MIAIFLLVTFILYQNKVDKDKIYNDQTDPTHYVSWFIQAIVTIEDVPIVKFGMEATNGVIHMIDAPLPIWMVLDYDKEDEDDDDDDEEVCLNRVWNNFSKGLFELASPSEIATFNNICDIDPPAHI